MTERESIEASIRVGLKVFEDNTAEYRKINDNFDVLDFRRPNSVTYSFRMVFDREHGNAAYISGDLGEAVIYPTCECTLEGFAKCFTRRLEDGTLDINERYFKEKIRACDSARRDEYDMETVKEDLKEKFAYHDKEELWEEFEDNYLAPYTSSVEVYPEFGAIFDRDARKFLEDSVGFDYEDFCYLGRRISARIILWLVAIRLAWEQVDAMIRAQKEEGRL